MPAIADLVINDGLAVPVARTFVPLSASSNQSVHVYRREAIAAGDPTILTSFSPPNGSRRTYRVNLRVNLPTVVLDSNTSVSSVLHTARFNADVVIPEAMTQADRDDFAAFIKNALADSVIEGIVADLDPIY